LPGAGITFAWRSQPTGATHRFQVEGELVVYDDALRIRGERPLAMSDYGIKPVTALGGTIRPRTK
jgi:hypothetical protein